MATKPKAEVTAEQSAPEVQEATLQEQLDAALAAGSTAYFISENAIRVDA